MYCGAISDKEFIISIEAGRIYASDTLYGYNFEIGFNPKKLRFKSKLLQNTLAELFEVSDATFHGEGYVRGYAANLKNRIVYGDKPLMAFVGTFLSDCDDTSEIKLNYIEFTDEFKPKPDTLKSLTLKMSKNLNATDNTKLISADNLISFKGIESKSSKLIADINSTKNYKNIIVAIDNRFEKEISLDNFRSNNKSVLVDSIQKSDSIRVYLTLMNNINKNIEIEYDLKSLLNESKIFDIFGKVYTNDDCNCINKTNYSKTSIEIVKKDTVINDIYENYSRDITYSNCVISLNEDISKINILNINGMLISEINTENEKIFDLSYLNNGVYFIIYDMNKNRKIIKILINKF